MKNKIFIVVLLLCSVACSPIIPASVTDAQIDKLQYTYAIAEWKASMAKTDECSSPAPIHWIANTFLKKNWSDCCWQHDFDYHYGYEYGITKEQADYDLWACVDASGHPIVANVIYYTVGEYGFKSYKTGWKQ